MNITVAVFWTANVAVIVSVTSAIGPLTLLRGFKMPTMVRTKCQLLVPNANYEF